MDAKLKAKWVALLRSGAPQCFGRFAEVDAQGHLTAFCAVGLLRYAMSLDEWTTLLASRWSSLRDAFTAAQSWNDNSHLSFPEIADRLEAMA